MTKRRAIVTFQYFLLGCFGEPTARHPESTPTPVAKPERTTCINVLPPPEPCDDYDYPCDSGKDGLVPRVKIQCGLFSQYSPECEQIKNAAWADYGKKAGPFLRMYVVTQCYSR